MRNIKIFAVALVFVTFVGVFNLPPAIFSLINSYITIESTGRISTSNVTAFSGSPEDIQAAVDAVETAGGGTVYVPEGDFAFNIDTNKTYNGAPIGVLIHGGVNVIGQGKNKTILRQTVNPPTDSRMFMIDGQNGLPVRISGFTFRGHVDLSEYADPRDGEEAISQRGVAIIRGTDYRVDHCSFIDFAGSAVMAYNNREPYGANRGVVDHCDFDNPYKDEPRPVGGGLECSWAYGVHVSGSQTWEEIDSLLGGYDGLTDIIYVEDCNFSRCRHSVTSNGGAFYVVRYCTLIECRPQHYTLVDVHGISGTSGRGGRGLEAYNNQLYGCEYCRPDCTGQWLTIAFGLRGGGGVVYNNTITDCDTGVQLQKEGDVEENWIHDLWIWNNTCYRIDADRDCTMIKNLGDYVENEDYFLYEKAYTPNPYPHPLTLEGSS